MTSQPFDLETRINILNTVLSSDEQQVVDTALRDAEGDLPTTLSNIEKQLSESEEQKQKASELLPRVNLAYSVADLSEDNEPLVRAIAEDSAVNNLRDMALNFNVSRLAAIVDPQSVPETLIEDTDDDEQKKQKFAVDLQHKLFAV